MLWTTKEYKNNNKGVSHTNINPGSHPERPQIWIVWDRNRTKDWSMHGRSYNKNKVLEDHINGSKYYYCFVSVSLQVGDSCVTELVECNACSACEYTFEAQWLRRRFLEVQYPCTFEYIRIYIQAYNLHTFMHLFMINYLLGCVVMLFV